jgi:N-acetylglucosaminyldiphosphoundecaprenol N-acetyl-beta-D-mannosaminyltransferase
MSVEQFEYSYETPPSMFILGVRVDNIDRRRALEMVCAFASHGVNGHPTRRVYFTNVHTIHMARQDRELMRQVNTADLVLPDGKGLMMAGKIFNRPICENLNGTDFTPLVLRHAAFHQWRVYLVGGNAEVVDLCRGRIARSYPGIDIVGATHGYLSPEREEALVADIAAKRPHILLVAMGTPIQEKWIARNSKRLQAGVCLAVGGLFDFIAGKYRRAPLWMRRLGLEWLYRFVQDPRSKWQRVVIEIPSFLAQVMARRLVPAGIQRTLLDRRIARES